MYDDPYFGLLFGDPLASYSPWDSVVENPVEALLAQPLHVLTQYEGSSQHIRAGHDIMGYPAPVGGVPQETLPRPCSPPVRPSQPMSYVCNPGLSIDVIDGPVGRFAGAVRPIRQMFRGTSRVSTRCQWQSDDLSICGEEITGETVPKHLASHGIRKKSRELVLPCSWQGCGACIKRQGIVRHWREVHLGLKRKPCVCASSTASTPNDF